MTNLTVYSSTNDAMLMVLDPTYATCHAQQNAETNDYSGTSMRLGQAFWDGNWYIRRNYFFFDTSALPDDCTINSATLYIKVYTNLAGDDFDVTAVEHVADEPPANANYEVDVGIMSVSGGTWNTSNFSSEAYYGIVLNATGRGWINKTGTTKIGLRSGNEIAETAPDNDEWIDIRTADVSGTGSDPYLSIEYSTGVVNVTVEPDAQASTLTLQAPTINFDYLMGVSALSLALTQQTPTINYDYLIAVAAQTLSLTLQEAEIILGLTVYPDALALALTLQTPTINYDYLIAVAAQTLSLTLQEAQINYDFKHSISALTLALLQKDPTIITEIIAAIRRKRALVRSVPFYARRGGFVS